MKSPDEKTLTPQEVLVNPLNSSISKFQFSFPKADRFNSNDNKKSHKTQSSYHYYDMPSTNNKKAPSFGIGQKGSVFNIKTQAPPSTKYSPTLLDDFDHYLKSGNKKNKGFSFSTGRQQSKSNSFIKKNQNPGPGNYNPNPQTTMNQSFYSYSVGKDQRFQERQKAKSALDKISIPGPGYYKIKSTLGGSNKILSQDRNVNPCPKLMLPNTQSRRIQTQPQKKIYNPLVTKKGDFITFNKRKGFTMGKSLRSNVIKNKDIPGPGKYRIFSQFIPNNK